MASLLVSGGGPQQVVVPKKKKVGFQCWSLGGTALMFGTSCAYEVCLYYARCLTLMILYV